MNRGLEMQNTAELFDEHSTVQEALDNFAVLIDDVDFADMLSLMGIGKFQFLLRKQMRGELKGLYMALWHLALARSFPDRADEMFNIFLERYLSAHGGKIGIQTVERAKQYRAMLLPSGDGNFIDVARHLASFLIKDQQDTRALTLKLALNIRNAYRFIFDRLI